MNIRNSALRSFGAALLLVPAVAGAQEFRLIVTHLEPPLVPNAVMDLAVELGYFEEEGVDVELVRVQQTPSAIAALMAGEGEMANVGLDAVVRLAAEGDSNFVAVTSPNKSLPFLIAAQEEIAAPADLAGRSFGVGRIGSLDHSLSTQVLTAAGVDPESLSMVTLGQPAVRAQALAAGRVDATTMSIGTWLALPETEGLAVLIPQDAYYEAAPVVNKVNVVPEAVLEERRDDVVAVVRALTRLSRDFAADPGKWAEAMKPYAGNLTDAELQELAQSFAGSWSVNGGMNRDELAFSQEWLYESEDFAGVPPTEVDAWADFSVVDEVLQDLGTDPDADHPAR